jgi:hypothetical protein
MSDQDEAVKRRAHELWARAGAPSGREHEFWARAAEEIEGPRARLAPKLVG